MLSVTCESLSLSDMNILFQAYSFLYNLLQSAYKILALQLSPRPPPPPTCTPSKKKKKQSFKYSIPKLSQSYLPFIPLKYLYHPVSLHVKLLSLHIPLYKENKGGGGFPGAQTVKNPPAMRDTRVQILGQEDLLEKGEATHSGIPAWRIPWTEEPGGLRSMESQRVGQD